MNTGLLIFLVILGYIIIGFICSALTSDTTEESVAMILFWPICLGGALFWRFAELPIELRKYIEKRMEEREAK